MEEYLYYGELFNIYKDLLSDNKQKYYSLYYEENLTLQEIADLEGVSKSYVGNIVKKVTKELTKYESILKIYENKLILREILENDDLKSIKSKIAKIINE